MSANIQRGAGAALEQARAGFDQSNETEQISHS